MLTAYILISLGDCLPEPYVTEWSTSLVHPGSSVQCCGTDNQRTNGNVLMTGQIRVLGMTENM